MLSNFPSHVRGLKAVQRYDLYLYLQNLVCMNFQCDVPLSQFISAFLPTASDMTISRETESFNADIDEVISTAMAKARENVSASANIPSTNRNKEIIRQLYQQGIFNLKDAVITIAEALGISKNTVYLHLRNLEKVNN